MREVFLQGKSDERLQERHFIFEIKDLFSEVVAFIRTVCPLTCLLLVNHANVSFKKLIIILSLYLRLPEVCPVEWEIWFCLQLT